MWKHNLTLQQKSDKTSVLPEVAICRQTGDFQEWAGDKILEIGQFWRFFGDSWRKIGFMGRFWNLETNNIIFLYQKSGNFLAIYKSNCNVSTEKVVSKQFLIEFNFWKY